MKGIGIILSLCVLAAGCASKNKQTDTKPPIQENIDLSCEHEQQRARKDLADNNARYYYFGINTPDSTIGSDKRRYNIKIVSLGCAMDKDLKCYNEVVDSFVRAKNAL